MESKTTVYVLRSEKSRSRYYTGITSNIARRLEWHNKGQNISTASDRPWRVHVLVRFSSQVTAERFERYLKSGSGREFARRHFEES